MEFEYDKKRCLPTAKRKRPLGLMVPTTGIEARRTKGQIDPVKALVFLSLVACIPTVVPFLSQSLPFSTSQRRMCQVSNWIRPWKHVRRRDNKYGHDIFVFASTNDNGSHASRGSSSFSPTFPPKQTSGANDDMVPRGGHNSSLYNEFHQWKTQEQLVQNALKDNNLQLAFQNIKALVALAEKTRTEETRDQASEAVDRLLQALTSRAFAPPYHRAQPRVALGMDALSLQLSSALTPPFNTVPKRVFLNAMRALTALNEVQQPGGRGGLMSTGSPVGQSSSSNAAFRILQRLVTGVGIRRKEAGTLQYSNSGIQEKDFNMVLNSFSNMGRMDMAHRIVALQERTKNAPPLSPVAYSILLKGYGRLKDLRNVVMIITHAQTNRIQPDTIMLNSLIDAYINCNAISQARAIFDYMTLSSKEALDDGHQLFFLGSDRNGVPYDIPQPNRLTYNTMLKGLASASALEECLSLSQEMAANGLWDDVTTNTLVHAAVMSRNFSLAEDLLERHTCKSTQTINRHHGGQPSPRSRTNRWSGSDQHPNVEAYTELLDGYAKVGDLDKALSVMVLMKQRDVDPNEVTYTCLVAALARRKKVDQARKIIRYMKSNAGLKPSVVTYNAFISGLVSGGETVPSSTNSSRHEIITFSPPDEHIEEALKAFYEMMDAGVQPNEVTLSVLILALGRCRPNTRVQEAKNLLSKLGTNGISRYYDNEKFATALVQVCGYGEDILGALEAFQKLRKPDLMAVNTFLDACCRCNCEILAIKTFQHYFEDGGGSTSMLKPDVISYSIVIGGLLKKDTTEYSQKAQLFYQEMRSAKKLFPDKAMVDLLLKAIIKTGKLQKKDVQLVASLLRDAEKLDWGDGQLERRKRALQRVMSNPSGAPTAWRDDDDILLRRAVQTEETLFKRKGWNKVDSGFRLWGGGRADVKRFDFKKQERVVDEFLESHGWNDVDSGFRIF